MVQEEVVVVQEGEAVNIYKWQKKPQSMKIWQYCVLCAILNIITTVYIETERELKQL